MLQFVVVPILEAVSPSSEQKHCTGPTCNNVGWGVGVKEVFERNGGSRSTRMAVDVVADVQWEGGAGHQAAATQSVLFVRGH